MLLQFGAKVDVTDFVRALLLLAAPVGGTRELARANGLKD